MVPGREKSNTFNGRHQPLIASQLASARLAPNQYPSVHRLAAVILLALQQQRALAARARSLNGRWRWAVERLADRLDVKRVGQHEAILP
jgi:hypothetical protein